MTAPEAKTLADVLDRLVSVELDLVPICKEQNDSPISRACEVLRSAIADLRATVHELDGARFLPAQADLERHSDAAARPPIRETSRD